MCRPISGAHERCYFVHAADAADIAELAKLGVAVRHIADQYGTRIAILIVPDTTSRPSIVIQMTEPHQDFYAYATQILLQSDVTFAIQRTSEEAVAVFGRSAA